MHIQQEIIVRHQYMYSISTAQMAEHALQNDNRLKRVLGSTVTALLGNVHSLLSAVLFKPNPPFA